MIIYTSYWFLLLLLPSLSSSLPCKSLSLIESIPDGLSFPPSAIRNRNTTSALFQLIDITEETLDIAEFYFILRPNPRPSDDSDSDGRELWQKLAEKSASGPGKIRIVQNIPNEEEPSEDSRDLVQFGVELRYVNLTELIGNGILHTKLWISDKKHFYLGSSNTDWRSLRQVKEMGLLGIDCDAMGEDLQKMFDIYWYLTNNTVPSAFPSSLDTVYNMDDPMKLSVDNYQSNMDVYLVSSPPPFCSTSRTNDIDGLLHVINSAEKFINIEVMEYFPAILYVTPEQYWPVIDDALRRAAFNRGVTVRLLIGPFPHNITRADELRYLKSLAALNGAGKQGNVRVEVRLFIVPSFTPAQENLRYARVNHAKFMTTDKHSYISTSNWSGDYFTSTAGISSVVRCVEEGLDRDLCQDLLQVFVRDWQSEYAKPLSYWGREDMAF